MAEYTPAELLSAGLETIQVGRDFALRPENKDLGLAELMAKIVGSDEYAELLRKHVKDLDKLTGAQAA